MMMVMMVMMMMMMMMIMVITLCDRKDEGGPFLQTEMVLVCGLRLQILKRLKDLQ